MPTRPLLALAAAVLLAAPAAAADKKPAPLRDFPFWTAPKTPHAHAFVPGLQAALGLTAEQGEAIEAACRDTVDKPENRTKNSPTAAAAAEKLHAAVAKVLTGYQKKLIADLNDAYAGALAEAAAEYQPKLVAAKGNAEETAKLRAEMRDAVAVGFTKKLDTVLTADQRKAVADAAAERTKRDGDAAKAPKPGK